MKDVDGGGYVQVVADQSLRGWRDFGRFGMTGAVLQFLQSRRVWEVALRFAQGGQLPLDKQVKAGRC